MRIRHCACLPLSTAAMIARPRACRRREQLAVRPALLDQIVERGVLRVGRQATTSPSPISDPATGRFEASTSNRRRGSPTLGVKLDIVQTSWPQLAADFSPASSTWRSAACRSRSTARKGLFLIPYLREGKTPIARCADRDKYSTIADIDRPEVRVVVNPGGTNERFARANLKSAPLRVFPDNRPSSRRSRRGADVMMTDASETRYQSKLHPGVLCAIHPDKPFDFAEKAVWMQRDAALKRLVDAWLRLSLESGQFRALAAKWME